VSSDIELILQGVEDKAITEFIGPSILESVSSSPERKIEVQQRVVRTRCVCMRVSSRPDEDAILSLNLSMGFGYKLKEILYE
jgi:hypothetical protein